MNDEAHPLRNGADQGWTEEHIGGIVTLQYPRFKELQQAYDERLVTARSHPRAPYVIWNYTPVAQFDKKWNDAVMEARGLILTKEGEIVSRPFRKFFNLEEYGSEWSAPKEPFEVYEKLDGSLGVLYFVEGKPMIATRGSFESEQAVHATKVLHEKYAGVQFQQGRTYLFEIIYPENRIVVDYGKTDDLILLAVIDNETGNDLPLENIGFEVVKKYDGINDLTKLKGLERENAEGFVVKFASGLRLKVKFAEYVRLHRLITQVSNTAIWDVMATGGNLEELLDRVPDEFYEWVKKTQDDLKHAYCEVEEECRKNYSEMATRKETAMYFQTQKYPAVLFKMLDKRPYSEIIWKIIKPKWSKPFKAEI